MTYQCVSCTCVHGPRKFGCVLPIPTDNSDNSKTYYCHILHCILLNIPRVFNIIAPNPYGCLSTLYESLAMV